MRRIERKSACRLGEHSEGAGDTASSRLTIPGVTVVPQGGEELTKGAALYTDFATFSAQLVSGNTEVKAKGSSTGGVFLATSLEIEP